MQPALPFALESLEIFGPCAPTMWAVIRQKQRSGDRLRQRSDAFPIMDIDLCDQPARLQSACRASREGSWAKKSREVGLGEAILMFVRQAARIPSMPSLTPALSRREREREKIFSP